jgi:hypothetical protein
MIALATCHLGLTTYTSIVGPSQRPVLVSSDHCGQVGVTWRPTWCYSTDRVKSHRHDPRRLDANRLNPAQ